MVEFEYLYKGLCGLARAHRASGMAGHLGAALVAGYFFGEEHSDLDGEVYSGVEKELDLVIQGEEAFWFNAKKAGITVAELFEPFPDGKRSEAPIGVIATALANNVDRTRQSGHNVIFAALSIRALHDHPEYATPAIVDGIRRLIGTFDNQHAGRGYYGKTTGWKNGNQVRLSSDTDFPAYRDLTAMAETVIDHVIASASVRKRGFGGLIHIINHAAAILDLDRFGYKDIARRALPAHHHHVRLWRSLPDVSGELGAAEKAEHSPRTAKYWIDGLDHDSAQLTHRIKTLYGFFRLLELIDDPGKRRAAEDNLLYFMT